MGYANSPKAVHKRSFHCCRLRRCPTSVSPRFRRAGDCQLLPGGRSLVPHRTSFILLYKVEISTKGFSLEGGAPRSESKIQMIAGGNHTTIPSWQKSVPKNRFLTDVGDCAAEAAQQDFTILKTPRSVCSAALLFPYQILPYRAVRLRIFRASSSLAKPSFARQVQLALVRVPGWFMRPSAPISR